MRTPLFRLTDRRRALRTILLGAGGSQSLALIRNVSVARLLGPHQFGIAAALLLTMQFLDILADASVDKLLIQSKSGDDVDFQAMAHALTIGRGIILAVLLLSVSPFTDTVFGAPGIHVAFLLLCLAPLVSGFQHLDFKRLQRGGQFGLEAWITVIAEACSLIVSIGGAYIYRSYFAVALGLLTRILMVTILSQLVAQRSYKVRWSAEIGSRFWSFSWPLLLNGPITFVSSQGDRIVITSLLGLRQLGLYSASSLLINVPSTVFLRALSSLYFPSLSAGYHEHGHFGSLGKRFVRVAVAGAVAISSGYAVLGGLLVHLLYGASYDQRSLVIILIGQLQAVRFLRTWPSTLAFSMASNSNLLWSNVVRLVSLPLAALGVYFYGGVASLLLGFIAGEWLALGIGLLLLHARSGGRQDGDWTLLLLFISLSVLTTILLSQYPGLISSLIIIGGGLAVAGTLIITPQRNKSSAIH